MKAPGTTGEPGSARRLRWRPRPLDLFALPNLVLLAAVTGVVSWPRFVHYRGAANVGEFIVYLVLTAAGIGLAWTALRHLRPPLPLLCLFQLAFLLAVAGMAVPVGDGRLYDMVVAGVRFDKVVHFVWAFAGALAVAAVIDHYGRVPPWLRAGMAVLAVLGLGAAWELVEYLVVRSIPEAGVGGYDNNMQDLIANACGGLASLGAPASWRTTGELQVGR